MNQNPRRNRQDSGYKGLAPMTSCPLPTSILLRYGDVFRARRSLFAD
jgi:hypothetical protein